MLHWVSKPPRTPIGTTETIAMIGMTDEETMKRSLEGAETGMIETWWI